jgi:hypothetical protein
MVDASDFLSSFGGAPSVNATQAQIKAQRDLAAQMMQPGQVVNGGGYVSGGGWAGAMADAVRQAIGARMLHQTGASEQAQLAQARAGGLPYGMGGAQPAAAQSQPQPQAAAGGAPTDAMDLTAGLETGHRGGAGLGSIARDTPNDDGTPSQSYGNLGLNSRVFTGPDGKTHKNSAWEFSQKYGPLLGLRGDPGTAEFNQSWSALASNPQTAPLLAAAEKHYYDSHYAQPSQRTLAAAGIPPEVAQNPAVSAFFADRTVQHGDGNVAFFDKPAIQQAWQQSGGDPAKFLQGMSQHDMDPNFWQKRFSGAIAGGRYGEEGNTNRVMGRLQGALQLAGGGAPGGATPAAGGQPAPQAQPPQSVYPQMASDEQLHALMTNPIVMANPQLMEHVIKQAEAKQGSLMPQPMTDPSGNRYMVNPRMGAQNWEAPAAGVAKLPVQGKPEIERFKTDISGVGSFERPAYYTQGPQGLQLQRMPVMPPQQQQQGQAPGGIPDVTPRAQPMGAPGGGYQPTGMQQPQQGGAMPVQAAGGSPLAHGAIPNSSAFGQLPGASGAGPMPDIDTANPADFAEWAQRRQANSRYMDKSAEELAASRTGPMSKAVEEGNASLDKLRDLAIIQHFYDQPHVVGGPLAEYELPFRSALRQMMGQNVEKDVPASELVNKFKTALAYEATRAFSNRPAVIELLGQMKVQPGLEMSDQAARYVLNLLQQDSRLKIGIGDLSMEKTDPTEFYWAKKQYYKDNPLISPLTGQPISEKSRSVKQLNTETNPETEFGIAGQFVPGAQRELEKRAQPKRLKWNPATGDLE